MESCASMVKAPYALRGVARIVARHACMHACIHSYIHQAIIYFSTSLSDHRHSYRRHKDNLSPNPSAPKRTAATAEKHIASDMRTARLVVRGRLNGCFIGALMDSITLRGKRTEPDLRSSTEGVPARIGGTLALCRPPSLGSSQVPGCCAGLCGALNGRSSPPPQLTAADNDVLSDDDDDDDEEIPCQKRRRFRAVPLLGAEAHTHTPRERTSWWVRYSG